MLTDMRLGDTGELVARPLTTTQRGTSGFGVRCAGPVPVVDQVSPARERASEGADLGRELVVLEIGGELVEVAACQDGATNGSHHRPRVGTIDEPSLTSLCYYTVGSATGWPRKVGWRSC